MIFVIGWILLWFRPEYKFVFFFGIALVILDLITNLVFGGIPAAIAGGLDLMALFSFLFEYLVNSLLPLAVFFAVGCAIVALRKWMKGRKSPADEKLDAEMKRIRAEIAARESK
ncbi:MAG TPA: hypothetical protein PLN53_05290 [Terricaulis sp.]|nr:hypothetical protein [Terricaulis sp.]